MKNNRKFPILFFLILFVAISSRVCSETLSLGQIVEKALQFQPSLAISKSGLKISDYSLIKSISSLYPQINVSASYNYNYSNDNSSGSGNYSAGASVSQKIYDFGRTGGSIRSSIENKKSSEYALQGQVQSVVYDATQKYFEYLKAKHIVDADSESLVQADAHLSQIKGYYAVGIKPRIDVVKSMLDRSNSKLALISALNSMKIAKMNLAKTIGLNDSDFEAADFSDTASFDISLEECLNIAAQRRPDLKQKESDVKAAQIQLAVASSSHFPSISASGNYGYSGDEFPLNSSSWGAGVNFSLPIFSGFSVSSQVKTQEENYKIAQKQKQDLDLSADIEIRQAYFDMKEKRESIDVARESLNSAEENYSLAQGRYLSGTGSIIELSDARASLVSAKTSYIRSIYDYNISIASLKKVTGY